MKEPPGPPELLEVFFIILGLMVVLGLIVEITHV